jgi:hypothetical protein
VEKESRLIKKDNFANLAFVLSIASHAQELLLVVDIGQVELSQILEGFLGL